MAIYHRKRAVAAKSATIDGPGSNGFWKRTIFVDVGTFNFVAPADGLLKIQALGAGAGGQGNLPGASGAYGEKLVQVLKGQVLTVVVGAGSLGTLNVANPSAQAGTTSISGDPIGGTPLTLVGAKGGISIAEQVAGFGTGPWDLTNPGAKPSSTSTGSPSSGSPFRPGQSSTGAGGAGWARGSTNSIGAPSVEGPRSRHQPRIAGSATEAADYWDLSAAENLGANQNNGTLPGIGAGGFAGSPPTGSFIGGGPGYGTSSSAAFAGKGAGGGGVSNVNVTASSGGDGMVIIFFDEGAS